MHLICRRNNNKNMQISMFVSKVMLEMNIYMAALINLCNAAFLLVE